MSAPTIYDTSITTYANFNNFQRINDYYKIEIGDVVTAWAITEEDLNGNVDTDVTFDSSAALAVPAAIILAAISTL